MSGAAIEGLRAGMKVQVAKTVTAADVDAFASLSGDFHPNHVDDEYARAAGLGGRVAHGALLVAYASAASTRVAEMVGRPMVSVGYDRVRFVQPVRLGDVLTIDYEITDVLPERRRTVARIEFHNQRSELVAVATHLMQLID